MKSVSDKKSPPSQNFRRLYPYYRLYHRQIRAGLSFLLGTSILALAAPYLLKLAIDSLRKGTDFQSISYYALLIVIMTVLQGICRFYMRKHLIGVSRLIEYDIRNELFDHLQKLSMCFYSETPTGDIISRCTEDLNALRMLLGPGAMHFTSTLFIFLCNVSVMLTLSARLTLLAILPLPLISLVVKVFSKKLHFYFQDIHQHIAEMNNMIQETFSGIKVTRAYAREDNEIDKFEKLNRENMIKNMRVVKIWGVFIPLMLLTSGLGMVIVLWWGGREVVAGTMTLGDFVAFNTYLAMLSFPMMALGWVITLYQKGYVAMSRINEILDREPKIADKPRNLPNRPLNGSIEIRNLTFSYNNGQPVLKNINLHIPEGKTFALVGRIGSGKSTLLKLIPRLFEAEDNCILVGGENIRNIPLKTLRSHLGYVPQEPVLYSDSLQENIAFGLTRADPEAVINAALMAELFSDAEAMPDQFDTLIGEKGVKLSGGQKQRTTLARALITNPKILLLDNIFSSIDSYTEKKIMANLKHYLTGRTCLIVSHRLSTIKDADQIIVLEEGKIQEMGTHRELLKHQSLYASMYRQQRLLDELTA